MKNKLKVNYYWFMFNLYKSIGKQAKAGTYLGKIAVIAFKEGIKKTMKNSK